MLEFNTLSVESQPGINLLHLVQVNHALALSTTRVGEIFEEELPGEFALFQCEPTAAPSLQKQHMPNKVSGADKIEKFHGVNQ